jgi:putative Holliday junction resolvase
MQETGRILAIDYGSQRVGLALSDPLRIIASGAGTLENNAALMDRIVALVGTNDVQLVVIGMPYAPDGGKGEKAREIERFIHRLREHLGVSVQTWDESYSSVNARRAMQEGGMKKKQRQEKGRIDEMAARLLLEEFMESNGDASPATRI